MGLTGLRNSAKTTPVRARSSCMAMAHGDGPPKAPGEYPREGYDVLMCVLHLSRSLRADFAGRFPSKHFLFRACRPVVTPSGARLGGAAIVRACGARVWCLWCSACGARAAKALVRAAADLYHARSAHHRRADAAHATPPTTRSAARGGAAAADFGSRCTETRQRV